mmetsp:Transcript_94734/g.277107  ORF Transcript_94734/g.277107 Transcript_94734/m.277107 type:complete len:296 (+) Transcript_94734:399-1286(+)
MDSASPSASEAAFHAFSFTSPPPWHCPFSTSGDRVAGCCWPSACCLSLAEAAWAAALSAANSCSADAKRIRRTCSTSSRPAPGIGHKFLFNDQVLGSVSRSPFEKAQRCCSNPLKSSLLSGGTASASVLITWSVVSLCSGPASSSKNVRKMSAAMPSASGGSLTTSTICDCASGRCRPAASGREANCCIAFSSRSRRSRSASAVLGAGGGTPAAPTLPVQVGVPRSYSAQSSIDCIIARSIRFNSSCWASMSSLCSSFPSCKCGCSGRTKARYRPGSRGLAAKSPGPCAARQRMP